MLDSTSRALARFNYQVSYALGLAEAIYLPKADQLDLLLSDIVLADGTGLQLAEELTRIQPELPVLLMSGYGEDKVHIECISRQGYLFLEKPFTVKQLLRAVKRALYPQRS